MATRRRNIATEACDRDAIALLLKILDGPRPVLAPMAFRDHYNVAALRLIEWGLLRAEGHQPVLSSRNDPDLPVSLTWSPEDGAFGYFDPFEGWIRVEPEVLSEYPASIPSVVKRLLVQLDMRPTEPRPLLDDLLWNAGDIRLPGLTKRTPVWFARRLAATEVWDRIRAELVGRPVSVTRIVLTPTPRPRLPDDVPFGTIILALSDLVDMELPLDGKLVRDAMWELPRHLHSDQLVVMIGEGAEVRLKGEMFRIAGSKQRRIVSYIYECYAAGRLAVSVAEVMEACELRLNARLQDFFKRESGQRVMTQLLFEKEGMCGFRLPE